MDSSAKTPDKIRSKIMRANKSAGTRLESRLRMALCRAGVSGYRLNCRDVLGTPDLCFPKARVVVFAHGCFWHGCRTCKRNLSPKSNSFFWRDKIHKNRARDRRVCRSLRKQGWIVITVWEHSVNRDACGVVGMISGYLKGRTKA